jgi:hypothetical protein
MRPGRRGRHRTLRQGVIGFCFQERTQGTGSNVRPDPLSYVPQYVTYGPKSAGGGSS